jgi:hypothetical protein
MEGGGGAWWQDSTWLSPTGGERGRLVPICRHDSFKRPGTHDGKRLSHFLGLGQRPRARSV